MKSDTEMLRMGSVIEVMLVNPNVNAFVQEKESEIKRLRDALEEIADARFCEDSEVLIQHVCAIVGQTLAPR